MRNCQDQLTFLYQLPSTTEVKSPNNNMSCNQPRRFATIPAKHLGSKTSIARSDPFEKICWLSFVAQRMGLKSGPPASPSPKSFYNEFLASYASHDLMDRADQRGTSLRTAVHYSAMEQASYSIATLLLFDFVHMCKSAPCASLACPSKF